MPRRTRLLAARRRPVNRLSPVAARAAALCVVALALCSPAAGTGTGVTDVPAGPLLVEDFETGLGRGWTHKGFPAIQRRNRFSIVPDAGGNHYLGVDSDRSASGMGLKMAFQPDDCPFLSWRWKVDRTIERADLTRREGDDAAARLYVIFDGPSRWNPLDKRILVYVWASIDAVGTVLPNAWLPAGERMIVLRSGADRVGDWVDEHVHLTLDFARAFAGERAGVVRGIAFLADTDNTHSTVSAGLDDLVISCRPGHR